MDSQGDVRGDAVTSCDSKDARGDIWWDVQGDVQGDGLGHVHGDVTGYLILCRLLGGLDDHMGMHLGIPKRMHKGIPKGMSSGI